MPRHSPNSCEPIQHAILDFFRGFPEPVERVTVAVSGGTDSTALLHALAALPSREFEIGAAHVNHHLRGAESAEDEAAVRRLCASLDVPLAVLDGALDESRVRARGVEAAARERRYSCLRELRSHQPAHWIATAHQADDQAETLLLRLVTGRGPWRLAGIRPVQDGVIRPLLHVGRDDVDAYLRANHLEPRRDSSNDSPRYLRNRIRREVLPILVSLNPRVVAHLGETAELEREREALLSSVVSAWAEPFERTAASASILLDRLPADPLIRRLLVRAEIRRIDPDERYLDAPSLVRLDELATRPGRIRPSRLVEVSSDGTTLAVRRVTARKAAVEYEFALAPGQVVETSAGGWHVSAGLIEARDAVQRHTQHVAITPGRTPVLVVRNRRRGDRFKPLGMREEKKLSDFFIDRKIPSDIRDTLPLVLIDDRIAWIAGIEVSDDFRLGRGDAERLVLSAWRVGDER